MEPWIDSTALGRVGLGSREDSIRADGGGGGGVEGGEWVPGTHTRKGSLGSDVSVILNDTFDMTPSRSGQRWGRRAVKKNCNSYATCLVNMSVPILWGGQTYMRRRRAPPSTIDPPTGSAHHQIRYGQDFTIYYSRVRKIKPFTTPVLTCDRPRTRRVARKVLI